MASAQDILDFWLNEVGPQGWYKASDKLDAQVRARFEPAAMDIAAICSQGAGRRPHPWDATPTGALAVVIALDQFPRNMYRHTPAAFAWDHLALSAAARMVETGQDLKIDQQARAFVYMPFMHAEDHDMQAKCVALVDARIDHADVLHHAREHQAVIKRFGRFPHRNMILGRDMTPEEAAFLDAGGFRA